MALSAELDRLKCHGRIQMAWNHWYTPGLSSALLDEPSRCPKVLHLNTLSFPGKSLSIVCSAVAASVHLEELEVMFCKASSGHVESVCEALRENKSLKSVTLREDSESLRAVATAAKCLIANEFVTVLELYCNSIDEASADMLALLLVENKSIWMLRISSWNKLVPACRETLSRAFVQNHFITVLLSSSSWGEAYNRAVREVLTRNYKHLRQAARFVVGKNREKVCAEAFEHFRSKDQLLRCATFMSGMSEAEERAAEKAAELFIERNYLFINRVVCHKVECHAGRGTQIDQLNSDCWLAIVKYLKVSDVIEKHCDH